MKNRVDNLIDFLEKKSHDIFFKMAESNSDPELLIQMSDLCDCVNALDSVYADYELHDRIAKVAETGDPTAVKLASLFDDLVSYKSAIFKASSSDDELERLRTEYSNKVRERDYKRPGDVLNEQLKTSDVEKAYKTQVKTFRPCEHSLSTRYDPDHPGVMLTRISENVFQSSLTGKVYDFYSGFTTNKGNKVPGVSVDRQIPDWNFDKPVGYMFDTRDGRMSSKTASEKKKLKKQAEYNYETGAYGAPKKIGDMHDSKSLRGLAGLPNGEVSAVRGIVREIVNADNSKLMTAYGSLDSFLAKVAEDEGLVTSLYDPTVMDRFRARLFDRDDINTLSTEQVRKIVSSRLKVLDDDLEKSGFYHFSSRVER